MEIWFKKKNIQEAQWKYLKLGLKLGAPATCNAKHAKFVNEYENKKNNDDIVARVFKFGKNIKIYEI